MTTEYDYTRRLVEAVDGAGPAARAGLANHPLMPLESLAQLCADECAVVRAAAATSPALTGGLAMLLAGDPDPLVRRAVLSQPLLSDDLLVVLAGDGDAEVRRRAQGHACMPIEVRDLLGGLEPRQEKGWARLHRAAGLPKDALEGEGLKIDEKLRRALERMRQARDEMHPEPGHELPVTALEPAWDLLVNPAEDAVCDEDAAPGDAD